MNTVVQWLLIILSVFLLGIGTGAQDYIFAIALIIIALFLRIGQIIDRLGPTPTATLESTECQHYWDVNYQDRVYTCRHCGAHRSMDSEA